VRITRVYSDAGGETHFADEEISFSEIDYAPPAPPLHVSAFVPASRIGFLQEPAGWIGEAHPTPQRQYVLILAGTFQASVSDGEERTFPAGSVVLLEDVTGAGHRTSFIGDEELCIALVQVPG
jgi:hypothetical protein